MPRHPANGGGYKILKERGELMGLKPMGTDSEPKHRCGPSSRMTSGHRRRKRGGGAAPPPNNLTEGANIPFAPPPPNNPPTFSFNVYVKQEKITNVPS